MGSRINLGCVGKHLSRPFLYQVCWLMCLQFPLYAHVFYDCVLTVFSSFHKGDILKFCMVKCYSYVILCEFNILGKQRRIHILNAVLSLVYLVCFIKLVSSARLQYFKISIMKCFELHSSLLLVSRLLHIKTSVTLISSRNFTWHACNIMQLKRLYYIVYKKL